MKKCSSCNGRMKQLQAKTPEGVGYNYFRCVNCHEEIVDMKQLHAVANKFRMLKKYEVRLTKWGVSIGLRIPKELVQQYHLRDSETMSIIAEKEGLKLIPVYSK